MLPHLNDEIQKAAQSLQTQDSGRNVRIEKFVRSEYPTKGRAGWVFSKETQDHLIHMAKKLAHDGMYLKIEEFHRAAYKAENDYYILMQTKHEKNAYPNSVDPKNYSPEDRAYYEQHKGPIFHIDNKVVIPPAQEAALWKQLYAHAQKLEKSRTDYIQEKIQKESLVIPDVKTDYSVEMLMNVMEQTADAPKAEFNQTPKKAAQVPVKQVSRS